MKLCKGERVCALLVCNKWGVDFMCYVGYLENIEKTQFNTVAQIKVDTYIDLKSRQKHKPTVSRVDAKLFKVLPWSDEVKAKVKALRAQSRELHAATVEMRRL